MIFPNWDVIFFDAAYKLAIVHGARLKRSKLHSLDQEGPQKTQSAYKAYIKGCYESYTKIDKVHWLSIRKN